MVDAGDLKSSIRMGVRVRVPPSAPNFFKPLPSFILLPSVSHLGVFLWNIFCPDFLFNIPDYIFEVEHKTFGIWI